MRIRDLFNDTTPVISFEFFPPKTPEAESRLALAIDKLRPLEPSFVSVTYGAGGSTRDRTLHLVQRIKNEFGLEAMAHLTCVGSSRAELTRTLDWLHAAGIENILCLRGDPQKGSSTFERAVDGFGYASELIAYVREGYGFCLGGACYPEGHVECPDLELDLQNLKHKVQAGAEFLITQLFFDPEIYFRFVRQARAAGVDLPILPGIMPVTNVDQLERFTSMCGATIPRALRARLEAARHDPAAVKQVGIEHATELCAALLAGEAPGVHFYTLNQSPSTRAIFQNLRTRGLV